MSEAVSETYARALVELAQEGEGLPEIETHPIGHGLAATSLAAQAHHGPALR